jgi:hypothetical protein
MKTTTATRFTLLEDPDVGIAEVTRSGFVSESDQAGAGGSEPAALKVEVAQMRFEVRVQPRTSGNPGMLASVPGHIDEGDQVPRAGTAFGSLPTGADPAETVPVDLPPPIIVDHLMLESLGVQLIHLCVVKPASPHIRDHHVSVRADPTVNPPSGFSLRSCTLLTWSALQESQ